MQQIERDVVKILMAVIVGTVVTNAILNPAGAVGVGKLFLVDAPTALANAVRARPGQSVGGLRNV